MSASYKQGECTMGDLAVPGGNRWGVPFKMRSDGWVLLLLCALIGVAIGGPQRGLWIGGLLVVSLLLHEMGHVLMATLLRVQVREVGLSMMGAYIRRATAGHRYDEALIAFAGPMVNFCLVVAFLYVPRIGHSLAVGNLALGVVNLIPMPASDGRRIWRALTGASSA